MADIFALKAEGEDQRALEAFEGFEKVMSEKEPDLENYFDHHLAMSHLLSLLKR